MPTTCGVLQKKKPHTDNRHNTNQVNHLAQRSRSLHLLAQPTKVVKCVCGTNPHKQKKKTTFRPREFKMLEKCFKTNSMFLHSQAANAHKKFP